MIPNPWVILGIVLAWGASLVAVGYWQNGVGHVQERVGWQGKQIAELATATERIKKLEEAARAAEAQHAAELAVIGADYEAKQVDAEDQRRRDVIAARDGALKLRVIGACPVHADGGAPPAASTAPAGRDGPAAFELPGPVAADLLALADDADQVARQLAACQAVVRSDRNPEPSK